VVRHAVAKDGRALIVERVLAPANEGRDAKFSDLNMFVVPGDRERTREEFAALLEASGLRLEHVLDTGTFPSSKPPLREVPSVASLAHEFVARWWSANTGLAGMCSSQIP